MNSQEIHQMIYVSSECPYITQSFSQSSNGNLVSCLALNQSSFMMAVNRQSYSSLHAFQTGHINIFSQKGYKAGQIIKSSSSIYNIRMINQHYALIQCSKPNRKKIIDLLEVRDLLNNKKMYTLEKGCFLWAWVFPQSLIFCLRYVSKNKQEEYSMKLIYYQANRKDDKEIATFGATFKDQKLLMDCCQLDSNSKMGWVSQDKQKNIICYMLILEGGSTKLEKFDVSFQYPRLGYGHFWHPLWQLERKTNRSTYLMAHMRILVGRQQRFEFINYCICTLKNNKITPIVRFEQPKKEKKAKFDHLSVQIMKGGFIFLRYTEQLKQVEDSKIYYQGILDPSRATFTLLRSFKRIYFLNQSRQVYHCTGSRYVTVVDLEGDLSYEYPEWTAKIKILFTDLHIKDVYMSFLLKLNSQFDDDLLLDAMELLTI